jgi:hypothetical protein
LRKFISLTMILLSISVFVGCNRIKYTNTSLKFSFDIKGNYLGFANLPRNYDIEKAEKDGYLVMLDSEIISNSDMWDSFVTTSLRKESTSVRIVKFYTEGTGGPFF